MSVVSYEELERLIDAERFAEAAKLCQAALASRSAPQFWLTQLGYTYFLNEYDEDAYFNRAPSTFEELVDKYPSDVNALFWLGYVNDIILHDLENARAKLEETLVLNPHHPYANLVLAGLVDSREGSQFLERTLEQQPDNFRAYRQLADLSLAAGRPSEAEKSLAAILAHEPYVEHAYGIMNKYINGVLTGSIHADAWREEARAQLKNLHENKAQGR